MKKILCKKFKVVAITTIVITSLTGCASFNQYQTIKSRCATSRVLITNLTQPASARKLMLPEGQRCIGGM